jgi:hypothetical protein
MTLIKAAHMLLTAHARWKLIAAVGRQETMESHARLYVAPCRGFYDGDVVRAGLRASAILTRRAAVFAHELYGANVAYTEPPELDLVERASSVLDEMRAYKRKPRGLEPTQVQTLSLHAPKYLDADRFERSVRAGVAGLDAATKGGVAVRRVYFSFPDEVEPWTRWSERSKLAIEMKGTLEVIPAEDAYGLLERK